MTRLVSASVIAEALQIPRSTVYSLARRGNIKRYPGPLFDAVEVARWIRRETRREAA